MKARNVQQRAYGDYQTPPALARAICDLLLERGIAPRSLLEPTCGIGSLLSAALDSFLSIQKALAVDINPGYLRQAQQAMLGTQGATKTKLLHGDFFSLDWSNLLASLPDPLLVIGNPPWVTNSELSSLSSSNLPHKSNFQRHAGLDAKTGKSNFDISEWVLLHLLEQLRGRAAVVAMLCKTGTARRVIAHAWRTGIALGAVEIRGVDAARHFDASVQACLLLCDMTRPERNQECSVYSRLDQGLLDAIWGLREDRLVADVHAYELWRHLAGKGPYRWRSGVKHDCAKVFELQRDGEGYRNGQGEYCELEDAYLYPLLKSSDIASEQRPIPSRHVLIPQRSMSEDTRSLCQRAPCVWSYLNAHAADLDARKSSIYRNRPRFSLFGVGEYSFAPWKVAVSGLYKRLHFAVVAPFEGKPVMLDDTCSLLACESGQEAEEIADMLNSDVAAEFYNALIFWDAKRPITVDVLERLDLGRLARQLGRESLSSTAYRRRDAQLPLL